MIFLWLQSQTFYKNLQTSAISNIAPSTYHQSWVDIGCSTGLLTRLAHALGYDVIGYDLNRLSLQVAKLLSFKKKNIAYKHEDFYTIEKTFDVISATSLLSVVDDKRHALNKLISLLKNTDSTLIIIEPTEKLTLKNVYALIHDFKTFWFYKGLLLWAIAREGKAIDKSIYQQIDHVQIEHSYFIEDMVSVTYIYH